MEKFQHITGGKKKKIPILDTLKRNSFTLFMKRCPKAAELQWQERASLPQEFSSIGKMRVYECQASSAVQDFFSLWPNPEHWVVNCMTRNGGWGQRALVRGAARAWNGIYQRDKDPTNCFMGSIKKLAYEQLGTSHLWIPPAGSWVPPTFLEPHPHTHHTPWLTPCECFWGQRWEERIFADS